MLKNNNLPKRSTVVGYVAVRPVPIGSDMETGEGGSLGGIGTRNRGLVGGHHPDRGRQTLRIDRTAWLDFFFPLRTNNALAVDR